MTSSASSIDFTYDSNGMRVGKTVTAGSTVTDCDYTYNGSQLTGEVITTNGSAETLYYSYDASGTPVSVKYNNTLYFYVTNLQGDVTAILNSSGTIVVEYTYDAWGYIRATSGSMASTLGRANALRYRSYVYDRETGLYYLQSRYYNPGTGRFINADVLVATGQGLLGNNMFAYCNNNPVNGCDPCGTCIHNFSFNDCERCAAQGGFGWEEKAAFGATVLIIGLAILLAAPTGGASVAVGGLLLSTSTLVTVGGTMVAAAGTIIIGDALIQASVDCAKPSKKSGKEKANDPPSWVSKSDIDLNKSAHQNAKELLDNKYGSGGWKKGPKSEYNQIVKWIDRGLKPFVIFVLEIMMEDDR